MKGNTNHKWTAFLTGAAALGLAVALGFAASIFSITCYAATGKITASGTINIRKEPSTTSEILAGVSSGKTVTVNSKTTGADNQIWYQVVVDSQRVGYIRSDLISVTEDVPTEGENTTPSSEAPNPSATYSPTVAITAIQPVNATLGGGDGSPVRVRGDADNNSADNIITQLENGTVVPVTGYATGTDNVTWYQISFDMNGTAMQGFVRYDYALLDGDLIPLEPQETESQEETTPPETEPADTTPDTIDYEVIWGTKADGEEGWLLNDYVHGKTYEMDDVINFITVGKEEYKAMKGTVVTQRIIIGVLAVLTILGAGAATVFFFKIREINDEAYFSAVERQTMRERNESRRERGGREPQEASGRRSIPTVGADGQRTNSQNRSQRQVTARSQEAGQRQAGTQSRTAQGQGTQTRTNTARTANGQPRQVAPGQGSSARTSGQTAGQSRPVSGQSRSASQVAPTRNTVDSARQAAARTQEARTARPAQSGNAGPEQGSARPTQSGSSKPSQDPRGMDDDDSFEFEFLNWDGEDKG